ncbi:cyclic nucleotide-binding domain-containing protein [Actinomarinicola tropica]|uniref:Cyclic nucleotide-binding domain-containing protein n=1 Tax=Actinomarinicola tropica TaxID=2789776 RepID=A0A5Q2RK75_9ACTN|nr:cyclic nucleotide-binding domain-containing protein [Actinomarinicola tropica]QGG95884.1 cyclic nucleotide-binding domain-containing protein [Actinomarinicola tropica]
MADHTEELAGVALFAGATKRELAEIDKLTTEVTLAPGTVLVDQGEIGREAFVILEGEAEVQVDDTVVATVGPGACVGEIALLDGGPRSASVVALTEVTALVLDPREFRSLLLNVPAIAVKVAAALAAKVRELDTKLYG